MMKGYLAILACLFLLIGAAWAEGSGPACDPFLPVRAADMLAEDAVAGEDGSAAVHTGSRLTAVRADFGDGAGILRLQASAPEGGRLMIRVFLDDAEGPALGTAVFSPITKEFRLAKPVEGVHDVILVFEGEGVFTGWQAFASAEDITAAIRAEHSGAWEDTIPTRYTVRCAHAGTVEKLTYQAHDYSFDRELYEKTALVYLPFGYDPSETYPLLILCHGIGGNEYEWGLNSETSRVRCIMDNLIDAGEIRPFIVVTPNGRGGRSEDYSSFYLFDQELRGDLLPAIAERYAVDIHDRTLCAMAGLSMGGMQTINLGLGKCLDLFSAFGAFSAAPTSITSAAIAATLNASPDLPVRVFYSICGTEDNIAYAAAAGAVDRLDEMTDRLDRDNCIVQFVPGGHDFGVWYLGFYNFARLFGGE